MHTFIKIGLQFLVCFFVLFQGDIQAERRDCVQCGCCPHTKVIAITAGDGFSVALKDNGTVWTWGWDSVGQLGNGVNGGSFNLPGQVVTDSGRCYSFRRVIAISAEAGGSHTLALKIDNTVWAWGSNSNGQLGPLSPVGFSNVPVQIPIPTPPGVKIKAIAAGETFSLALDTMGSVWAWGNNSNGQLGSAIPIGPNNPNPTRVVFPSALPVIAIAGGGAHALAILSNNHVWAWGDNTFGQLGNNMPSSPINATPTPVSNSTGFTTALAIAAGNNHSIALDTTHAVWDWGRGLEGQLDSGLTSNSNVPVSVTLPSPALAIAGGGLSTYALTNDNTIWSWGDNTSGQLGHGTTGGNSAVPGQVLQSPGGLPFTGAIAIAGGNNHALTLKDIPRSVWAWGDNTFGELGIGTPGGSSDVPVRTLGL